MTKTRDFICQMEDKVLSEELIQPQEAERLLRRVLEIDPRLHEVDYSLGLLLAEMDRYPEAARYLQKAAAGLSGRPRIHYNLGLLLQRLGRWKDAEVALLQAIDKEPGNLDFLYAAADHYLKRSMLKEAEEIAKRMVVGHPTEQLGRDLLKYIDRASREAE